MATWQAAEKPLACSA